MSKKKERNLVNRSGVYLICTRLLAIHSKYFLNVGYLVIAICILYIIPAPIPSLTI